MNTYNKRNNGIGRKAFTIMIFGLICMSGFSGIIQNGRSAGSGNYPPPGDGDWVITNETYVANETIRLNGNLIIESGGNLTLRNVTLIMNCSEDGEFGIVVQDGGKFSILDYDNDPETEYDRTNITAVDTEYEFKFLVDSGAEFEMRNSELSECGYEWELDGSVGLTIKTNNTIIDNSIFYNNYYGIYLRNSTNNTLANNKVSKNDHGIRLYSSNNNTITNNSISNNDWGIYLFSSYNNIITNNNVYSQIETGIYLYLSTNNRITNNGVSNNEDGITLADSSNNQIRNNGVFSNNNFGIYLRRSSNNNLTNNIVSNSDYGIRLWKSSNNSFKHNTIFGNELGILLMRSSKDNSAHYNNIFNNSDYAVDALDNNEYSIDAINNWWGNASGPYNANLNPEGKGDKVSFYVEFDPWFQSPVGEMRTLYVDDDASDGGNGSLERPFNKIMDAMAKAENMDTIRVFEGIYYENIVVNKTVNIIGNSSGEATIVGNTSGYGIYMEGISASSIRNLYVNSFEYGIYLLNSDNNEIINVTLSNNKYGIYLQTSDENILSNNKGLNITSPVIYLWESSHNIISGNKVSNNRYGIMLHYSNYNTIIHNNASQNSRSGISLRNSDYNIVTNNTCLNMSGERYDGVIQLSLSDNNLITNNTASDSLGSGIYLKNSHRNTLSGNILTKNRYGISLYASSYTNFARNYMVDNGISVRGASLEWYNTHSIDTTNTVNGKPVRYYKNSEGITVPSGAGQIIIADCEDMLITDQNLSNGNVGIIVAYSSSITIKNNVCNNNNEHGIYLHQSDQNTLNNNNCSNNRENGIYLHYSAYNTISDNICRNNRDKGIILSISDDNTLKNNTCSYNDGGIYLSKSDDNTLKNNTCSSNKNYGLTLRESDSNSFTLGTIHNNNRGIYLYFSSKDNTAHYNNIFDNLDYGIDASNNDGFSVDATYNWWGDPSGSYHAENNSEGKGDKVTDNVEFDPWIPEKLFNTLYVTKYGNDTAGNGTIDNPFLTIQKAVAESNDWDTIRVFEGVYEENIVVNKSVEIIGNGNGETIIDGMGKWNPDDEEDGLNCRYIGGFGGVYYDVAYDGEYLYAAHFQGVSIFNVSDPSDPEEMGFIHTNGSAQGVAVNSDYAYVADGSNGLVIVDISDPQNPTEEGHLYTAGQAYGVAVSGNYAYVADYNNGLVIVDISDPRNPTEEGHYDTEGYASGVAVSGDYAYVADHYYGLVIVDISDPGNPTEKGDYDSPGNVNGVAVRGDYAYVADRSNGLVVVDISDPSNPLFEGHIDTAGQAYGVAVSGEYAYIADSGNGLVVVDVSDPTDPTLAGHYDTSGSANGVAVSGGYAYVADSNAGLVVVDVSDPTDPTLAGHYDTEGSALGVAVSGGYAYVADWHNGLVVVDVSDPSDPQYAGGYNTADHVYGVAVSGDHAYVADGYNGLVIVEMNFPPEAALHIFAPYSKLTGLTISNGTKTGVLIDADNVEIENCEFTRNGDGIRVIGGSKNVGIYNNDIHGNTAYGINARENDGITITATHNWWGHPSGPYHPTRNLDGIGNEISIDVDFEPWLTRPKDFKIHHVAPDGDDTIGNGGNTNPYRTIQKAIDMAYEWDTIEVAPGTYSGSITINKRDVTILGDSPDTTILDAGGTATTCTITADNAELNGFHIKNGNDNGILITNSSGNRIVNCVFPDNSYDLNLTNSKNIQLINTTFETVNFNDPISSLSVVWPVDLKVTDNRSGFIPNAHMKITDKFDTTIFEGYTDDVGRIPQINLLYYYENISSHIDYNSYTISIWKDGYLNFAEEFDITSYTRHTSELETHILPVAIISGELVRYVDMDSEIFFDGFKSTGRSISYFWDLWDHGNWSTSDSSSFSHIYKVPGSYQVNLIVTDDHKNTSTASVVVIVENVPPAAVAGADMYSVFEDEPILFDASGSWDTASDSISFFWDFGDGAESDKIFVTHAFQDEGDYMVTLTVTDRYGGKNTIYLYVTVTNKAPWDVSAGEDISIFTEQTVQFQGSAMDTISDFSSLRYTWDFGNGRKTEGQIVSHAYSEPGVYSVNLTVTDNDGASGYALINVTVREPEIVVSASSYQIFQDETVNFNVSHELDSGSYSYTWYFGDGNSVEGRNVSHIFTRAGLFTPWLVVSDGRENTTIFLQEITVQNVIPVPAIQVNKFQVTEDESLNFSASGTWDSPSDFSKLSYAWDFGEGSTSFGNEVTHSFSAMENYSVRLTVSDGKDTNSTEVQIEVQNLPPVADAGTPKERKATEGKPVILDASGTADTPSDVAELNYTWTIGDDRTYGKTVSYTFETSGIYSVVLEVRDNNGAVSNDSLTIEVSKSSESDDEEIMSALSWILIVVMVVLLVVIGFLISSIRDEALYREMKAEEEEAIVVEGEIRDDEFKPKDDAQGTSVEVAKDQDVEIIKEEMKSTEMDEVKYEEKENVPIEKAVTDYESFKPTPTVPEVELVEDTEEEMPDEEVEVVEVGEGKDEEVRAEKLEIESVETEEIEGEGPNIAEEEVEEQKDTAT